MLVAVATLLSICAAKREVMAQEKRAPNIVVILVDDKYVCCLANSEKPLQTRMFATFSGFRQTTADCGESTGIAVN